MDSKIPLRDVMLKASVMMLAFLLSARFLGYVFHLVFARYFSKGVYGTFIFVWSLGLFLTGIIPNIASAVSRYVAYYRGKKDRKMVELTIRSGIITNTLLLSSFLLVYSIIYFFRVPGLNLDFKSFLFMAAVIVLTSNVCLFGGIITGYRRPEVTSFLNLVQNVLRLLAILSAVVLVSKVYGVMFLIALSYLIHMLILVSYAARKYGLGSTFDKGLANKLVSFGVFNVFYETANNLLSWADIFLIQFFLGSAVVAVYNVSWLASTVSLLFFTAALQIFTPIVTEMFGEKSYGRISYLTSYLLESFFLLFLPVFLAVILFSAEILVLFFTGAYVQGATPLKVLALGAFCYGLAQLFVHLINAEGKPRVNARNIGLAAAANVLLNLALIPSYGMVGAAAATLFSSTLLLMLSYSHVRGVIALTYSAGRILKIVASSLLAVGVVYLVKKAVETSLISLALSSASLILVYILLLVAFKSLREEDVVLVSSFLEKLKVSEVLVGAVSRFLGYGVQSRISS